MSQMTQYLLSIYQPDGPPPPEVMAQMDEIMANMDALVQETRDAGVWVFHGGLHDASTATVVSIKGGDVLMTDGPYAEGKEHVGGFLVIKASDLDAALAWARKLAAVLSHGTESLPVEVRPFHNEVARG
jgi:hypothetical protein